MLRWSVQVTAKWRRLFMQVGLSTDKGDHMNKMTALMLLVPVSALGSTPFDGTWKVNLESIQVSGKPNVEEIKDGMYTCSSCVPSFTVKADGTDQPTPVHNLRDHIAIKVVNATTVEYTEKKDGKITSVSRLTVSGDGNKLTQVFTNYTTDKPLKGEFTEKRVAPAAAGAHTVSGAWMQDSMPQFSEAAKLIVLQSTDNGLKMTWYGRVTDAKFDGKEYATQNDPDHTLVTLKKLSDRQFEERDKREGQIFDIVMWTASPDGKTITNVDEDPRHGTKTSMTFDKQP
jgi:flagellar hook-associated protein FlgK